MGHLIEGRGADCRRRRRRLPDPSALREQRWLSWRPREQKLREEKVVNGKMGDRSMRKAARQPSDNHARTPPCG